MTTNLSAAITAKLVSSLADTTVGTGCCRTSIVLKPHNILPDVVDIASVAQSIKHQPKTFLREAAGYAPFGLLLLLGHIAASLFRMIGQHSSE